MEGLFREIVCGQVEKAQKDPDNYLWHTFWFIVKKSDNCVVGSIDFKDMPDSGGEEMCIRDRPWPDWLSVGSKGAGLYLDLRGRGTSKALSLIHI